MKSALLKYKIGLGVVALFAIGLGIFVILQAGNTKQDKQTTKTAQGIAQKLNDYIDNEQKIPSSLGDANVTNVPDTVSYQKLSDDSYKFCVTYKTKTTVISPGAFLSPIGSPYPSNTIDQSGPGGSGSSSYLLIDESHPKGQQCQTIKKDFSGSSLYDFSGQGDGSTGTDNFNFSPHSTSPYTR